MLYDDSVRCSTREEFDTAIEEAFQLCLNTDLPMRVIGHCSPLDKGGNGGAGVMFGVLTHDRNALKQIHYSVYTDFPIDHGVFDISWGVEERLRLAGKLIGYSEWEEDRVTHVLTIPWNDHGWEYGMVGTDADAIHNLMKFNGSNISRGKRYLERATLA